MIAFSKWAELKSRLWPRTRFGKWAVWVVGLTVLARLLRFFVPYSRIAFLQVVLMPLFIVVVVRYLFLWTRRLMNRLLWRLRRRLIVTYVLIGLVPIVLLFSIVFVSTWFLFAQLSTFFVFEELQGLKGELHSLNQALAPTLANFFDSNPEAENVELARLMRPYFMESGKHFSSIRGTIIRNTGSIGFELVQDQLRFIPSSAVPPWAKRDFTGVIEWNRYLYFHSLVRSTGESAPLSLVLFSPIDRSLLKTIGDRNATLVQVVAMTPQGGAGTARNLDLEFVEGVTEGAALQRLHWYDFLIKWTIDLETLGWKSGQSPSDSGRVYLLGVESTWLRVGRRLFSISTRNQSTVVLLLIFLSGFFLIIELTSFATAVVLTRTITGAVHHLQEGATRIMRGDFSHRIRVTKRDQLGMLTELFNTMTESVERLLREQAEKQRLESELSIAREVQQQLFPKEVPRLSTLQVAGVCHPARIVSGDYYDYLRLGPSTLGLALGDVSGKGVSAALLMASIQAALRSQAPIDGFSDSARSAGAHVAEVVRRLNRQLYQSTPEEKYVTFFYAIYDDQTAELTYTNAGHLPPILITGQHVHRLDRGGTVVGLFEDVTYEHGALKLRADDVFVAFTDGIVESENSFGEEFGEQRLIEIIRRHRTQNADALLATILQAVADWEESQEPRDDMTLLVAKVLPNTTP